MCSWVDYYEKDRNVKELNDALRCFRPSVSGQSNASREISKKKVQICLSLDMCLQYVAVVVKVLSGKWFY